MVKDEKGSITPWIIGGLIGAVLIYFFMKNRQPVTQSMSQAQPVVIDTSVLERRLEDLSMRLDQMQFSGLSPKSYLTTTSQIPITKINEPLIKVKDDTQDKIMDKEMRDSGKGSESISKGTLIKKVFNDYYDVSGTITNDTDNNPNDPFSNVYDSHRIYNVMGRKADVLYVANDAGAQDAGILYVIVSHNGGISSSKEEPIYAHEVKEFHNVYEIKLRSPTQNLAYRVTEYKIMKQ